MWLSRIQINQEHVANCARDLFQNLYKEHKLLWEFFPDRTNKKRDFLYRREMVKNKPFYYLVSNTKPIAPHQGWIVETKAYSPQLKKYARLHFVLRVNPVVTRTLKAGKPKRHDLVMDKIVQLRQSTGDWKYEVTRQDILQQEVSNWFRKKENTGGFQTEPSTMLISEYNMHKLSSEKGKRIQFSSCNISGDLMVLEPDLFLNLLYQGLGKAKAFGCGLILIQKK